jgi:hypothetical protein
MPPAVTAPLSQSAAPNLSEPTAGGNTADGVWQYSVRSVTLNDCHLRGVEGPFQFNGQSIGSFPWTKTGAIEEVGGTGDAIFSGQQTDPNGCLAWILLLVHAPSFRATMNGGARCPDGMRSCSFQTEGQVVRLR